MAQVRDFLAKTSGYFLANVIRNMAADSPNNEVYDKIRDHKYQLETNSGLWVQLKGGIESFKKDENSLEDYKDTSYGVLFGFDRFLADKVKSGDLMWGVYGRINKDNIEQGENKADGNKTGLGLYGGYLKDSWELKAMLLGSYDKFSAERRTYGGDAAKADINGITISADLEAALKIWMSDNLNFRPYAGIEAANSMYDGFKESGAGMYALDTEAGSYLRSAGRIGAGLDY
jgi:outer membrane autotransporter protein